MIKAEINVSNLKYETIKKIEEFIKDFCNDIITLDDKIIVYADKLPFLYAMYAINKDIAEIYFRIIEDNDKLTRKWYKYKKLFWLFEHYGVFNLEIIYSYMVSSTFDEFLDKSTDGFYLLRLLESVYMTDYKYNGMQLLSIANKNKDKYAHLFTNFYYRIVKYTSNLELYYAFIADMYYLYGKKFVEGLCL